MIAFLVAILLEDIGVIGASTPAGGLAVYAAALVGTLLELAYVFRKGKKKR